MIEEKKFFPFFCDISGWKLLFIGGGKIAKRRIYTLLEYSCEIYVIAPVVERELSTLAEKEKIIWIKKEWNGNTAQELEKLCCNCRIIFACTDSREVNHSIWGFCKKKGIAVNVADRHQESDFYFPGIVRQGEVTIGAAGNGKNHKEVKMVMDRLREYFHKKILL